MRGESESAGLGISTLADTGVIFIFNGVIGCVLTLHGTAVSNTHVTLMDDDTLSSQAAHTPK